MTDEDAGKIGEVLRHSSYNMYSFSAQAARKFMGELAEAGFAVVPIKPTKEMVRSACRYGDSEGYGAIDDYDAERIWEDMLAVARDAHA